MMGSNPAMADTQTILHTGNDEDLSRNLVEIEQVGVSPDDQFFLGRRRGGHSGGAGFDSGPAGTLTAARSTTT